MAIEKAILNQGEEVDSDLERVSSALLTLKASRRFQKDKLTGSPRLVMINQY